MNTIRGRILLAFIALCVLVTPFIIFSLTSLRKIHEARNFKEQVALFNVNRLKAYSTFSQLMETDAKIDSFYKNGSTQNLKQYQKLVSLSSGALTAIQKFDFQGNTVIERRLQNVATKLNSLQTNVDSVIKLQMKRGFRDFGLEGDMRKNIHRLEQDSIGISLLENLMLRRIEKDFFLRGDPLYAILLNREVKGILLRMSEDGQANLESMAMLEEYLTSFNAIVALEEKIGNTNTGLLKTISELHLQLDHEVSKLNTIIDTNLNLLNQRIQSFVVVFFCITLIFAIFFTVAFSGHLTHPIKRLITDMDEAAEHNFAKNSAVTTNINVKEINKLANTYDTLIQKIQTQIGDLNTKNTELSTLNAKLKESETELKEASRIKDKFFSIISHDLRGHAGNVLSLSQIINNEDTLSEKEKSVFTKYLLDASQNLQLLLDNLLNWAKSQMNDHTISKKAFSISKLIEDNIHLVTDSAFRKGVAIEFVSEPVSNAYADKNMVDFTIRNLLSNALKFTRKGDTISLNLKEEDDFLKIALKDTGVGMTEQQVKQLLFSEKENFTTVGTQNEVGTGLGFAISKDFVQKNGGQIEITSTKGEGSTFTFTVPTKLTRESILSS